ncbi:MAG: D-xylose ABC transporter ATP-binding protein [Thermoprotei archaeon]|nr:MAG: D-xylose ABC transporter ATP-binding protein [Thermoprotei archaeon]
MSRSTPVLETIELTKVFPGVVALDRVNFDLLPGEIHGLVGQNGAGKSTFVKILNGILRPDSGKILIDGKEVAIPNPATAKRLGITLIHQEITLVPYLTVAENIFLGREPIVKKHIFKYIDRRELFRRAEEILTTLGVDIDPKAKVKDLNVGEQEIVQIARALSENARIICLDEPTSPLTPKEIERLFDIMRTLKKQGRSMIFITHRIEEVFQICDRVTVLRDGKKIATVKVSEVSPQDIVKMMLGRELAEFYVKREPRVEEIEKVSKVPTLEVIDLWVTPERVTEVPLKGISFKVYAGEILGVTGLLGAGKTELGKAIIGLGRITKGKVLIEGREVKIRGPVDALKHGIVYIPEDRRREGLVLTMSVKANISLPSLYKLCKYLGLIDLGREEEVARYWIKALNIVTPSTKTKVANLSGGNQQKVSLAKMLEVKPKIVILDEPTFGIDIGAKVEIRKIIAKLADEGLAVILLSSDIDEVLSLADRIVVMRDGMKVGEFINKNVSREDIYKLMVG